MSGASHLPKEKEIARDQAWIYLQKRGRKYVLEIHHDGGPWGGDRQIDIPVTRKQALKIEEAFCA